MVMMVLTVICSAVSVLFASFLLVDAYFDRKEEKEKQERKALQEKYRRLMEE